MAQKGYQKEEGVTYVSLKCIGGQVPGAVLAQKVGPMGISPKLVGTDFQKATADYASIKINARVAVINRKATVEVTPGTSSLIIKALNEPVRDRKKEKNILHNGNISLEKVIEIARIQTFKSYSQSLVGTVKQVLGTCLSIGCTVDNKSPKEVTQLIKSGEIIIPEE